MKMKKLQPLFVLAIGALVITGCKGKGGSSNNGSSGGDDTPTREPLPGAEGVQSFVYSSVEERTAILGVLEQYAVENKLTGLTLFNSGGYVLYQDSVVKGTNSYIPGYGFGILSEGEINADLAGETNAAWKRYYHTFQSEDPKQVNSMNSKDSTVSDVQGYLVSSYFDVIMNETRDGYEWVGSLAKQDRPTPLNLDSNGLATKYRIEVKVGEELKYSTLTQNATLAAFNGRQAVLEDYLTPYRILYTQAYNMERGAESIKGASALKGAKEYYNGTATAESADLWANFGAKAVVEEGKSYLEFEFVQACTPFYAMYYLSSGMMAPVPAAFIEALGDGSFAEGVKVWGASNTMGTLKPVDTWLSTGYYTLERWDTDEQIVFKRNELMPAEGRYRIAGVHMNILRAIKNDPEAALKEFNLNKLHACGIPSTQLENYVNDPRAAVTIGSSNFKLNLNTCTPQVWEQLFGENGSVRQTSEDDYWECEPAMANKDFVSGLSFAINRQEYAKNIGRNPAFEYFAPAYLSDPENGVSYNDTEAHKNAVKSLQEGTDGYGYSKELATKAFIKASEQLIADGYYKKGDTIHLEIAWQEQADLEEYHNPIVKYLTDAFNVDANPLSLECEFWVGNQWDDVYYKKMMVGQFDIGFGSISGNTYDPLSFLNVLSTDKTISNNFCLNWGIDTNHNDLVSIQYNGASWSFDGLFKAATEGTYLVGGENSPLVSINSASAAYNDEGGIDVTGTFTGAYIVEGEGDDAELLAYGTIYAMCIYACSQSDYSDYEEYYVYNPALTGGITDPYGMGCSLAVDDEAGTFEAHFSATIASYFATLGTFAAGFDVYSFTLLLGSQSAQFLTTIIDELPEAPVPAPLI